MQSKSKKLIYILNHYSTLSDGHFYHVINLLEKIADFETEIALVIEKCDDIPKFTNPRIKIFAQQCERKWQRPFELCKILIKLNKLGYKKIFIRISWVAAIVSIVTSFFTRQQTFYWLSGQGGFEYYNSLFLNKTKVKLFITSRLPFLFIKKFVYRFVTGPESMKEYFVTMAGVNANKIIILYNDIDLSRFKTLTREDKVNLKTEFKLPRNKKIIFFAHRFSQVRKTLFYLPFIFENLGVTEMEDYIIIIAGSGPEENEVKIEMQKVIPKHQLIFLGSIPNLIIQKYYQISDIFINPTFAEGFPRVLIEAMASGLPIVTTNAGGIKDILGKEQSNYMVEKTDRLGFKEKLIELSNSQQKRDAIANENLNTVRRFSTEVVAEMYINEIFIKN